MKTQEMKIGKSIDIYVTRENYRLRLISSIEEVKEDRVIVSLIATKGRPFVIEEGDQIEFIYNNNQRMHKWKNVKGGIVKFDDGYAHCFITSGDGEIYNRRNAFRLSLDEAFQFLVLNRGEELNLNPNLKQVDLVKMNCVGTLKKGIIKDLSETGIGFYTNEELECGDVISVCLDTEFGDVEFIGNIVRKSEQGREVYKYLYGAIFHNVSNNISKYVFAKQREQLQKVRGRN